MVYSHPALIGRSCFEQEFWRCVRSLSRALGKGTVLPGGGETERHCAMTLLSMAGKITIWLAKGFGSMRLLKMFCTHIYCLGIYKLVGIKYYIAYFPRGMQIVVSDSLTHCQNCNCQICTSYTCTYH